jgi:hypothetical protein
LAKHAELGYIRPTSNGVYFGYDYLLPLENRSDIHGGV